MQIIYIFLAYFLLIVGCSSKSIYIHPSFDESNQYFLEKVISQLNVSNELEGKISPNYNIAVLSIENDITLDKPIISMIEDQMIASLIQGGYKVVERDSDAIQNFIREGSEKYSLTYQKHSELSSNDNSIGNSLEDGIRYIETQLSSAGILISYRILEAGIIYHEYPEKKDFEIREALVRLHIRIHKTYTGEIVHATNLSSSLSDTIRTELVNHLAAFHFSFFPYNYPLQKEGTYKGIQKIKSIKIKSKKVNISKAETKQSKNRILILPRLGYGMNYNNGFGFITGGSISYGNYKWGNFGADLMYLIPSGLHTVSFTGFYKKSILKYITLKSGISYIKTGDQSNVGGTGGVGLSFSVGKIFIIQPMAEVNFDFMSLSNNILGINMNMGVSF